MTRNRKSKAFKSHEARDSIDKRKGARSHFVPGPSPHKNAHPVGVKNPQQFRSKHG